VTSQLWTIIPAMQRLGRTFYSASDAAKALGISIDTLRRWDRDGRIATERDGANRRIVAAAEIERLRGEPGDALSPRNRFAGTVTDVKVDGLLAQVELLVTGPVRVVAVVTRDAVEELALRPGDTATAFVKSTSMMLQH
jgi:molybdopterin-binding protein